MVAGKLLVAPIRPGVGMVKVLLVGSEIEEVAGCSCARRTNICKTNNPARRTMRENRITGPPRFNPRQIEKDERNSGGTLRSKESHALMEMPCRDELAHGARDPSTPQIDSLRESVCFAPDDRATLGS